MTSSLKSQLRGITWNHTRGYTSLVATAQRFSELHPETNIVWQSRSLQEFANRSIPELAQSFDLLVIDHPSIGSAAQMSCLLPLDSHLPAEFLSDQAANSVGGSHASYSWRGHQWALAIDAAAPVSGWREDLLARAGVGAPKTWDEVFALARRGLVAIPGLAIDSLMNLYMLCIALGEEPFLQAGQLVSEETGTGAVQLLQSLISACHIDCLSRNPIATWEELAHGESVAYCPFAYGYSNYSRHGYAGHSIRVGGLVEFRTSGPLRSTLGGAGLAVSQFCPHPEAAVEYAQFTASSRCQATLYFDAGGQPGHRRAWLSEEVNRRSNQFFAATLPTLDAAYVRPRFPGYIEFQDAAAPLLHGHLRAGSAGRETVRRLNALFSSCRADRQAVRH